MTGLARVLLTAMEQLKMGMFLNIDSLRCEYMAGLRCELFHTHLGTVSASAVRCKAAVRLGAKVPMPVMEPPPIR